MLAAPLTSPSAKRPQNRHARHARAQAAHSDRDIVPREHGSGVSSFCGFTKHQVKKTESERSRRRKRERRDTFSFICPGCETPSFIHSPCSLCRLLMRSPPDAEEVVRLISDPEQRRTHPQTLSSVSFFCIHTSLCLSISLLFQEPFSHLSAIPTQIGGSNHKEIPRKKCWKTLTSPARAGKGGVKGVGV